MNARAPMVGVRNGVPLCQRVAMGRDGDGWRATGARNRDREMGAGRRERTGCNRTDANDGNAAGTAWRTPCGTGSSVCRVPCALDLGVSGRSECSPDPRSVRSRRPADGARLPWSIVPTDPSTSTRPPLVVVNPRASRLRRRRPSRSAPGGPGPPADGPLRHPARVGPGDARRGPRGAARPAAADRSWSSSVATARIREAAAALAGGVTPLAIVPGGTGNVLAGALRVRGVDRALDVDPLGDAPRARPRAGALGPRLTAPSRSDTSPSPAGWASMPGSWPRRSTSGSVASGSARTSARPCARLSRLRPARFRIRGRRRCRSTSTGLVVLVANCGDLIPGRLGARQPLDPTDGQLDLIVVGGRIVARRSAGCRDAALADRRARTAPSSAAASARSGSWQSPAQPIQTDGDPHPPGWLEASRPARRTDGARAGLTRAGVG